MKNTLIKILDFIAFICLIIGLFQFIFILILLFIQIYRWLFLYKKAKPENKVIITRSYKSWAETHGN